MSMPATLRRASWILSIATSLCTFIVRPAWPDQCMLGVLFGAPPSLQIAQVVPGSPADQGGVRPGDIISSVNGVFVFTIDQLRAQLESYSCGQTVSIALVNPVDSPLPRVVELQLSHVDARPGIQRAPVFSKPPEYPPCDSKYIVPLDEKLAAAAKQASGTLDEDTEEGAERAFFLGRKNFEGEAARKFWSSALAGVQVGKAELQFYLITPYSEARYRFYSAAKQLEPLSIAEVVTGLHEMDYAALFVVQNAGVENLAANMVGWGGLATNSFLTKVVIRRGDTIYPSIGRSGAGWVFPLSVFTEGGDFEIVAVSTDNKQAILEIKHSRWSSVR